MCRNYTPRSWQATEEKLPHLGTLASGISVNHYNPQTSCLNNATLQNHVCCFHKLSLKKRFSGDKTIKPYLRKQHNHWRNEN